MNHGIPLIITFNVCLENACFRMDLGMMGDYGQGLMVIEHIAFDY